MGFLKLNFDGSVFGNPGSFGIGGFIRDHSVKRILTFSSPSFCSVNEVEMIVLGMGLRQAARLRSNITAEGILFVLSVGYHIGLS